MSNQKQHACVFFRSLSCFVVDNNAFARLRFPVEVVRGFLNSPPNRVMIFQRWTTVFCLIVSVSYLFLCQTYLIQYNPNCTDKK